MINIPHDADKLQMFIDTVVNKNFNEYKLIDKYVIKDGKQHPFALIVPGGGYRRVCSYIEGVPFARFLNRQGISAFILYYRVRELAHHPNPQQDVARALKEIFANADRYHLKTGNYSIWGSSAGGHLVGSFGTESMGYAAYGLPKPGALVLIYPVITLEHDLTHAGTRENHIGADADRETELTYSVHTNVTPNYPRTFVWCGDADELVPPENTRLMAKALETAGVPYEVHVYPSVGHGVGPGIGTFAEGWMDAAVRFWMRGE